VFQFLIQGLSETFIVLRRKEQDMIKNVYRYACEVPIIIGINMKYPLLSVLLGWLLKEEYLIGRRSKSGRNLKKKIVGKPVAKTHLKNLCKYRRVIIIKYEYNKINCVRGWNGLNWLKIGSHDSRPGYCNGHCELYRWKFRDFLISCAINRF